MNLYGWRPGEMPKMRPDQPFSKNARLMIFNYLTTPEAVEAVLPEPLEPGPNPFAAFVVSEYPEWTGFDGVAHQYRELYFMVECQYKGEVGLNMPFMYCGVMNDDIYDLDVFLGLGRETRAFPKKAAPILVNRVGDEWVVTMNRKGVRLVTFRARVERPVKAADIPTAKYNRFMMPKEIIAANFMGYDVQQLLAIDIDYLGTKSEILSCMKGTATLELSHTDNDPLDTLKIVQPGIFVDLVQNIRAPPPDAQPEILATKW